MRKGSQNGARMPPKTDGKSMGNLVPEKGQNFMKNQRISERENTPIYGKGHQKSRFAWFGSGAKVVSNVTKVWSPNRC